MKVFLTAEWRNLFNITWKIDPGLLEPHVPKGVELDVQDGHAFVSLVAFDFLNTKVKGIKVPFHVNFPEINLRYYLKHEGKRGVAFIREFVPKHCIAFVARKLYNEPYVSFPMESDTKIDQAAGKLQVKHEIWVKEHHYKIEIDAGLTPVTPPEDSVEHYFKEHDVGFGTDHSGKTLFYIVEHPVWEVYPVKNYSHNIDFAEMYGEKWAVLNEIEPHNALLAKGSNIKVFSPHKLDRFAAWAAQSDSGTAETAEMNNDAQTASS